ncbi:MAG TPA: hypothetical protein VGG54_22795 [Trebonia sp.]
MAGNTGEARTGIPEGLEWKGIGSGNGGLLAADEATGIVEAIVSVTGIVDEVKDIIEPGAYAETLRQRTPKGISGHDWGKLAAKTLDIKELLPGDPALPRETPDGKPWPAAAGALWVKAQYNLATQIGRDCFANIQFFGPETQWSIGYDVPAGKSVRGRDGTRRIKGLRLFEYSDVLFGAAPLTGTLSAKDAKPSDGDPDNDLNSWTTDDPEDAITQEADADDPDMAALHAAAISEMNAQAQGWDAIDAASAINAGEEEITDATADDLQAADQRRQGATATAGTKAAGGATTTPAGVSDTPWSDFTAADYTPAQWHKACLIHNHAPGEVPDEKGECLAPWTPVLTARGWLRADMVKTGDSVLTAEKTWRQVTQCHVRHYAGPLMGAGATWLTPTHPVLTSNGWLPFGAVDAAQDAVYVLREIPDAQGFDELLIKAQEAVAALLGEDRELAVALDTFGQRMPVGSVGLNGKGVGRNPSIGDVASHGLLLDVLDTKEIERGVDRDFDARRVLDSVGPNAVGGTAALGAELLALGERGDNVDVDAAFEALPYLADLRTPKRTTRAVAGAGAEDALAVAPCQGHLSAAAGAALDDGGMDAAFAPDQGAHARLGAGARVGARHAGTTDLASLEIGLGRPLCSDSAVTAVGGAVDTLRPHGDREGTAAGGASLGYLSRDPFGTAPALVPGEAHGTGARTGLAPHAVKAAAYEIGTADDTSEIAFRHDGIISIGYDGPVYNYEVETDHSYFAGILAVHNCKLPVRQPDGRVNVNGVHAAAGVLAGARGGVNATAGQKRIAAAQLRGLYRKIGDTPPSSLQAKVLTSADVTGTPPTGPSGPIQLRARLDGWAGGDPADYSTAQWHDATLIHNHPDGMMPTDKGDCSLPVCTPDGALSSQGMHAAAGALGSGDLDATDDQKTQAATALLMLFRRTGEAPPPIQVKVAGQDVTPADARATQRLKDWYVHGGGAAQIGWGVAGDFDKCVAIAGKHMDPAKAKGYCQLRHKDATGFYAGHAPSEELAHGAAAAITDGTKAAGINLSGGYNPALETGPYAGWRSPETKDIGDAGDMPGSIEETLDNVSDAVTAALGGSDTTTGGLPRWIVTVNGTWPDHVIATRYDTTGDLDDGESFSIAYTTDPDTGDVTLGEQTPVTLTVVAEPSDGTKSIGDGERLSAVPILVEYVAGFVRRGLQVKQGRVLSEVNGKLLRGAVSQLIAVLNAAGIPLDTPPDDQPDQQDQALATTGAEPLYLPDSTAPGAQVVEGKSLVGPRDMARQLRITAAAYGADGDAE